MNFIYLLTGWEGHAADCRVLSDAIHRLNGLKIPQGNFYLCDNGYTNGQGFLTPYKRVRYHLANGVKELQFQKSKELELHVDPMEELLSDDEEDDHEGNENMDFIDIVELSQIWTNWRDNLAQSMFNEFGGVG
ncbi:hypothetical protein DH2020_041738 [Rehmannia glutinosa]|uniref:DDE Tnp4 domain-containing protein n=1 Tax=Rehmannia glutinosa TaxID=99300 RepID=A0ABR0UQF8_REHGL